VTDIALVCGGGGALGSALVEALLARGDHVVSVDRRPDGSLAAAGLRREALDLTSAEEIEHLWSRLGAAGETPRWVVNAAVVRLTEVLAVELAPRGVRVNAILPSLIDTPANRASMAPEALRHAVAPRDIASVASFLLGDAAAAVTGAIVPVYGFA